MGKKIDEGMVQTIFVGLLIVAFGVLAGWFFNIESTLVISTVSILCIIFWIFDTRKNKSGGGSGDLGVFLRVMVPLAIFTVVLLVTGFIVHWGDLLYLARGLFR